MSTDLREMSQMIACLKAFGHTITNKQQVQVVIHSLFDEEWQWMKVNSPYNVEIKTFDDIAQHLLLEAKGHHKL